MRKPSFPFGSFERSAFLVPLFGAFGAAAGAIDAGVSELVIGEFGNLAALCAWMGGGIGLGIGLSLALSYRWWIGLSLSPLLGIGGYLGMLGIPSFLESGRLIQSVNWDSPFIVYLADIAAFVMVGTHLLFLHFLRQGHSKVLGLPLFAVSGAASGSIFWLMIEGGVNKIFWMGLVNGAIFGLCQFIALMAAVSLRRQPRNDAEGEY